MKKLIVLFGILIAFSVCGSCFATEAVQERDRNHEVRGWHVKAVDDDIDLAAELVTELDTTYAQLAAEDYITAVSASTADTTQTLTIEAIDTKGKQIDVSLALNGTSLVGNSIKLRYIDQVELDKECAGTVSLSRMTGTTFITSVPIGQLKAQMAQHFNGEKDSYITMWRPAVTSTDGIVHFELRWYPDDADCLDATDGYIVLDDADMTNVCDNWDLSFEQPIRCLAGGWLAGMARGVGTSDVDVSLAIQGYDVLQ